MRVAVVYGLLLVSVAAACATLNGKAGADEPLRPLSREPAVQDGEDPRLFYYSAGRKIYVAQTGFAAAKPKEPAVSGDLKIAALQQPITRRLDNLIKDLGKSGIQVAEVNSERVVTIDDKAINLDAPISDSMSNVEYVLDIVIPITPSDGPVTSGDHVGDHMAVTPFIVAKFSEDMTDDSVKEFAKSLGGSLELQITRKLRAKRSYVLQLANGVPTTQRILQAANKLFEEGSKVGKVVYAHPDFKVPMLRQGANVILDPRFDRQWHHKSLQSEKAWEITLGDPSIRIAIIDDSVQGDHPDLADNFLFGRYFIGDPYQELSDSLPRGQDDRHGTACAGLAASRSNNQGGRGTAPQCKLIGVAALRANLSQIGDAFQYCADPDANPATDDGAAIVSCSWRWNAMFDNVKAAIEDLSTNGRGGKGVVVLFAAANDSTRISDINTIATIPNVITVGAVDENDAHSNYSNFGPELSVVAPSSGSYGGLLKRVETTDVTGDAGYIAGDYTGTGVEGFGGTSASTPMVAGVCGLILSANPGLTARQVRAILEHTADPIQGASPPAEYHPVTRQCQYYGYGRVNAGEAVAAAKAATLSGDSVWPDRTQRVTAVRDGAKIRVTWESPKDNVAGVLVVRSMSPLLWRPEDKFPHGNFATGKVVGNGQIVFKGSLSEFVDEGIPAIASPYYSIFLYNNLPQTRYSWGQTVATQ